MLCVYSIQAWERQKDEVRSEGRRGGRLQQVLLLALAAVAPVKEGLLHLAVFVQPARLVGKIRTYRSPERERERATGRSEGGG